MNATEGTTRPPLASLGIVLPSDAKDGISFGQFRLLVDRRVLFDGLRQIRLGSRAMSILIALVERAGDLVTKEELVRIVWPETFVEEVNLRVHISALRRALADDRRTPTYIANIAGRGYCFVAPTSRRADCPPPETVPDPASIADVRRPLRGRSGLIGADSAVRQIASLLSQSRLVTVVGPPGVGKTTLAIEAAMHARGSFPGGVHVVDMSGTVSDARGSIGPTARILALASASATAGECLIVADACEQHILPIARTVEVALHRYPDLHILATSAERLRAEGEFAHHVRGLAVPDADADPQLIRQSPAVALFLDRVFTAGLVKDPSLAELSAVVVLARHVDGNPRALELAAVGAAEIGIGPMADRVAMSSSLAGTVYGDLDPFWMTKGLLDWSLAALAPLDLRVLRSLSVFAGSVTVSDASAVISDSDLTPMQLTECLHRILNMSSLVNSFPDTPGRLHVPKVIKAMCLRDLAQDGELYRKLRCRHADHVLTALRQIAPEVSVATVRRDRPRFDALFAEAEIALVAAAELPDPGLHADLAILAMPLGLAVGYVDDIRNHAEAALARVATDRGRAADLGLSLALLDMPLKGVTDSVLARLDQAAALVSQSSPTHGQIQLAQATAALFIGDFAKSRIAAARAGQSMEAFEPNARQRYEVDAITAAADHGCGDHKASLLQSLTLVRGGPAVMRHKMDPHRRDLRTSMRITTARSHWILGQADQARLAVSEALGYAEDENPLALCQTLGWAACPVFLLCGDEVGATKHVRRLRQEADHALIPYWQGWATVFEYVLKCLAAREGRGNRVTAPLSGDAIQRQTIIALTGEFCADPAAAKLTDLQGWCAPELIRLSGIAMVQPSESEPRHQMRERLLQAFALAERQAALAWQLRAAISLARFPEPGRTDEAMSRLGEVFGRFSEGHQTADLIVARSILRDNAS